MLHLEPGDITELIESGVFEESAELEAKRSSGHMPRNAWESISAFANGAGGFLVLGLEEANDGWRVSGIADPGRIIQDIHNAMRDRTKISHEASHGGDIWRELIGGMPIVVVRVAPAPRWHRPVFINGDRDLAFVRRREGDARCTDEELDRMRREALPGTSDIQVIPYLNMMDFDLDAVERYRQLSLERKPSLANHRLDTAAFLRSVNAWRLDREQRIEGPTLGGILMFGNDAAIREVRTNHVIDYRRVPTDHSSSRRWTDRVRWTGHLFGAWEAIFPKLVRGLPTPFRLRGPQRLDEPAGLEAVREAFVNLLVHADYLESSDAVILHRDDGYTFRNPGDSWVDPRDLGFQSRSERRNPIIAQMFDNIGLADQAGSGFIRILDEWRELGYRRPTVVSDAAAYEFELDLKLAGILSSNDRQWLLSIGGPWKEEEELALIFARYDGSVDNQTLRSATGQHLFDASQTLRSLRDRGYFVLHGSGRNARYVLGGAAQARIASDGHDHLSPGTDHLSPGTDHLSPNTGQTGASTAHFNPATESEPWAMYRLEQIAAPVAASGKSSATEVKSVIVRLCAITPLSSDELVHLLDRRLVTVRRYISALLESGELERVHPEERHPRQKYRAVEK